LNPYAEKERICDLLRACQDIGALQAAWGNERAAIEALQTSEPVMFKQTINLKDYLKHQMEAAQK